MARRGLPSLADMLRNQSELMGSQSAGQTVGGHYVPNWSQTLSPLVGLAAAYQGNKEQEQEKAAVQDWLSSAPQDETTFQQGKGPLADRSNVIPAATREAKLAHLLKGAALPGDMGENLTDAYAKTLAADAEPDKWINMGQGVVMNQKTGQTTTVEDYQNRVDQIEASRQAGKENLVNMRVQGSQETAAMRDQLSRDKWREQYQIKQSDPVNVAKRRNAALGKELPQKDYEVLGTAKDTADKLTMIADSFTPEFGGTQATLAKGLYDAAPVKADLPENVRKVGEWWAEQEFLDQAVARHELFGASLTPTEQAAWKNMSLNPNMDPATIEERLQKRKKFVDDKLNRHLESRAVSGYNPEQIGLFRPTPTQRQIQEAESSAGPGAVKGNFGKMPSQNGYEQAAALMGGLISTESGGDSNAVSPKGAQGITQIMPATAANPGFGMKPIDLETATDEQKIEFSQRYLGHLIDRYEGNVQKALKAYNGGMGNVDKGADLGAENNQYSSKVLKASAGRNQEPKVLTQSAAKKPKRVLTQAEQSELEELRALGG
jgi:soluble lytic murein transglycosylase-like protein